MSTVQFDFGKDHVKLGSHWHNCVKIRENNCIELLNDVKLQARSVNILPVKSNKALSLVNADFDPASFFGIPGVYTKQSRIIPNIDGIFHISLLHTTTKPVDLKAFKGQGVVMNANDTVATVQQTAANNSSTIDTNIVYGENLSPDQKSRIASVICKYVDIFASNPRRPTALKTMEHRIIT